MYKDTGKERGRQGERDLAKRLDVPPPLIPHIALLRARLSSVYLFISKIVYHRFRR